jgi:hypothetical protein
MILWLLYIITEAYIQYNLIKIGWKPNYIQLFLIRGVFAILHGAFIDVANWYEGGILIGFQLCSFWILFDLILNKLRGKVWDYKGKDSGWLDKIPYTYYYILKLLAFIGIFIFYIKGLVFWRF